MGRRHRAEALEDTPHPQFDNLRKTFERIYHTEGGYDMSIQSRHKEEEYFARVEMEKKRKLAEQHRKSLAEAEKNKLRELHYMRCPKCGMELREIEYRGVKVDRCFTCDGVWFDAGEVDALQNLESSSLGKLFKVFTK
jgi:uncharacterized protein